jgi:hypothetical protein
MTQREFNDFLFAALADPKIRNALIKIIAGQTAKKPRKARQTFHIDSRVDRAVLERVAEDMRAKTIAAVAKQPFRPKP